MSAGGGGTKAKIAWPDPNQPPYNNLNNIMASFTVADYNKKRKRHHITFHCEVGDRVEVAFLPGPTYHYGTISKVTSYRCLVEFDDGDNWWIQRYGQEAQTIQLTTAPPDYDPPQVEPEDIEQFIFKVVYGN
eukprot:SAG31_NODE_9434_length_1277_cov_4.087436_3_plen_132_part_00